MQVVVTTGAISRVKLQSNHSLKTNQHNTVLACKKLSVVFFTVCG